MKSDLEELKRSVDKLRQAFDASQKRVIADLKETQVALNLMLESFEAKDVSEELKELLLTMCVRLELVDQSATRKRAPKVTVADKIQWLKGKLKGKKDGLPKAVLLDDYANEFGSKRNPNSLDEAIEQGGFGTTKQGKSVTVHEKLKR